MYFKFSQVRRQETLDAFNEAEKSIHEANENALQVLQTGCS